MRTNLLALCLLLPTAAAADRYQDAVLEEPLDWRAWLKLAQNTPEIYALRAGDYFYRAIKLKERCGDTETKLCPAAQAGELRSLRLGWGRQQLDHGVYARADELLSAALDEREDDEWAQWGAVARFAASSEPDAFKQAYKHFKKSARNPQLLEGDGVFGAMLAKAFSDMAKTAESDGRRWAAYFHTQNLARVQALADKHQWPKRETREKILELYTELTRTRTDFDVPQAMRRNVSGYRLEPAVSPYARAAAAAGLNAAKRGKYRDAVYHFRMAMATDPWWYEGRKHLAYAYMNSIGLCGATHAGEEALKQLRKYPHYGGAVYGIHFGRTVAKWQRLEKHASRTCMAYSPGHCDQDPAVLEMTFVRPDCKVLP